MCQVHTSWPHTLNAAPLLSAWHHHFACKAVQSYTCMHAHMHAHAHTWPTPMVHLPSWLTRAAVKTGTKVIFLMGHSESVMISFIPYSTSSSSLTQLSPSPFTQLSPPPLTQLSPSPLIQISHSPLMQLSPAHLTQFSPSPLTQLSPPPLTQLSPPPLTHLSPSPLTQLSPSLLTQHSPSLITPIPSSHTSLLLHTVTATQHMLVHTYIHTYVRIHTCCSTNGNQWLLPSRA